MDIRGKKLAKPIDDLAGGRVYTGKQALELGLVDKLGGLDDAIKFAAAQAGLEEYETRVVPKAKNFLELLVEPNAGEDTGRIEIGSAIADPPRGLAEAALPLVRDLDPQRAAAVLRAVRQLEILKAEGVSLMMPELLLK